MSGDQNHFAFAFVIPAYNEERRLPAAIRDIRSFFSRFNTSFEVIIVVEKSTDRTVEVAQTEMSDDWSKKHFRLITNPVQKGKGYAVRTGMVENQADIVFFMDADLSTPLSEVLAFLAHFEANPRTDVVIGSRAHAKSQIIKRQNPLRQTMGRTFNRFVKMLGNRGIEDTQCGFKAFRGPAAREIFARQTINGFAFDVEVLLLARRLGYHVDVLPVRWVNSPDSKVNMLIDPFKMLWDLLRIRLIVRKTLQVKPPAPKVDSFPAPKF